MKWALVVAGCMGFGVVVAATMSANRPLPPAPIAPVAMVKSPGEQLADAYDDLFNDLALVKQGVLGLSRVPNDPAEAHRLPVFLRPANGPLSERIIAIRENLAKSGLLLEEGVISANPQMRRQVMDPMKWEAAAKDGMYAERMNKLSQSRVALWQSKGPKKKDGAKADAGVLFQSENRSILAEDPLLTEYADRLFEAVKKDPKAISHETIKGWTLYARAIPFRSKECLSCHPGRRLGDPAAIVSFATRKQPTK